jgi:DUF4097 and DUF4098 domain-containing protein YvlB
MPMTGFGRSAILAAVAVAVPIAALAAQRETETIDKTVPLPDRGTVSLSTFSGEVRITGTSGHDVVIHAVRHATRDRLDHIKLDVQTSGSTVKIDANKRDDEWRRQHDEDQVVETDFDIQVPASAELTINSFSSDITVKDVTGEMKLKTFSAPITVTGAKSAVTAESFSGGLDIDLSGAGAEPELDAHTFSGRIRARLADNAKGEVNFDSFSGSFDTDIPLALHSMGRRRTSASMSGGSGHELSFHTFSGNVRIVK